MTATIPEEPEVQARPVKNVKRLHKLARLFAGQYRLDMSTFCSSGMQLIGSEPDCGTTFCIAGLTVFLWGPQGDLVEYPGTPAVCPSAAARDLLGLTDGEACMLFYNDLDFVSDVHHLDDITTDEAISALVRMAAM